MSSPVALITGAGTGIGGAVAWAWVARGGRVVLTGRRVRAYMVSKLDRVNRHFDHVIDVNVVMSVEKLRQKVEANVHVSGREIHAASGGENLYAAIDELADRLDRQVLRHKERLQVSRDEGFERKRVDLN